MEIDRIVCSECVEFMQTLPDKFAKLTLTDAPYGVGIKYDIYDDSEDNWYELMKRFIPEAIRVSEMLIFPCAQIKRLGWFYANFPPDWIVCWHKGATSTPSFVGFNDWEALLVYGKPKGLYMHDHFSCTPTEYKGNHGHPCPKPISWASWIISKTTNPNDIVLDCFCGSGSVPIACIRNERHYLGCDISEEYCQIARRRIEIENSQLKLDFG